MATLYVYMYRYAFVADFSVFWSNETTNAVAEGEEIVLVLCILHDYHVAS